MESPLPAMEVTDESDDVLGITSQGSPSVRAITSSTTAFTSPSVAMPSSISR